MIIHLNSVPWKGLPALLIAIGLTVGCSSTQKTITLDDSQMIDTGYGKSRASTSTGPIATVNPNDKNPSNLQLSDMLRQIAGLQVSGSGTNASVRIRGASSFNASSSPLFVVDGNPLGTEFSAVAGSINPNDIKSIRALKGNEATIYGTRGANGVILIKLKKE